MQSSSESSPFMASFKAPILKLKNVAAYLSKKKKKNVAADDSDDDDDNEDSGNDLGLSLEKLNLGPRKKLLVLCLGGLLLHRVHLISKASIPKHSLPDGILGNFFVFRRPFCEEFLEFCFERFEVGIWSSARESNIELVLNFIMKGLRGKLLFVWSQEECTDSGFESLEKKEKPIFLKELNKIWDKNNVPATLPLRGGQFSSSNTLLIDDEPHTALLNPPNTAIFPHKYKGDKGNGTLLGPEGELQLFLKGLADADDVSSYVKEHRFGQPAITSSHSDWEYYSKIIRHYQNEGN